MIFLAKYSAGRFIVAEYKKILRLLDGQVAPISQKDIGEVLGERLADYQTQLRRMVERKHIVKDEAGNFSITDEGKAELLDREGKELPISEKEMGVTERDVFIEMGKKVGISKEELIKVTADHIFEGGDFRNMDWVWKGMASMQIPKEFAMRWANRWMSYLQRLNELMPPSEEVRAMLQQPVSSNRSGEDKDKTAGLMNYILDEKDDPVKVSDGEGTMNYTDAMRLSIARAQAKSKNNAGGTGDIERLVALVQAIRDLNPPGEPAKPVMILPGPDGKLQVTEYNPSVPMIIPQINPPAPPPAQKVTLLVPAAGGGFQLVESDPSKPIFIPQGNAPPANPSPQPKYIMVDRATGQTQEVAPGAPIIIQAPQQPAAQNSMAPVIQMLDSSGQPIKLDLASYFRLEEHKADMEQRKQSHESKMELTKQVKDVLGKIGAAAVKFAGEGKK
jgi:hypothetical protein